MGGRRERRRPPREVWPARDAHSPAWASKSREVSGRRVFSCIHPESGRERERVEEREIERGSGVGWVGSGVGAERERVVVQYRRGEQGIDSLAAGAFLCNAMSS